MIAWRVARECEEKMAWKVAGRVEASGVASSCACVASSHRPANSGWSSRISGARLVRVRVPG